LMRPVFEEFHRIAAAMQGCPPKISWISTVSAMPIQTPPDARYWCDHALNAVRFVDGMRALVQTGVSDFVEIGPGNTLLALGRQNVKKGEKACSGSLRKDGGLKGTLRGLGGLPPRVSDVDGKSLNRPSPRRPASLPTSPSKHRRFWIDAEAILRSTSSLAN